ncbi:hypothetical protein COB11_04770 [Candidatus Aerophobetes bacterium]|uniref:Leucine-rich repeat domain-containing protein n=1 Tax=Aerophobetes bacterium TaxID=2030807 RepID=A0A2A4YH34_UNCAE|nr:MAG: hypothetical protein COB11_04770 [Candidatus Aerophobetes bacterium]
MNLTGNCLCLDNDPRTQSNVISVEQFQSAQALKVLKISNNALSSPSELFPNDETPAHLKLKTLVVDRNAVKSTAKKSWPFFMEDDQSPRFV